MVGQCLSRDEPLLSETVPIHETFALYNLGLGDEFDGVVRSLLYTVSYHNIVLIKSRLLPRPGLESFTVFCE